MHTSGGCSRHFLGENDWMGPKAVRRLHWWPTEPSLRAMELGCGTGQLSFALLDALSSVTGVDPAQGMIDVLSEKIEESELGERMSAVCANLLEEQPEGLPLGSFDVIFSKLAFHHLKGSH